MSPVPQTIDLAGAERTSWDVVIVGAGCAGALAAREVARSGLSVLLVDKAAFPRWKVCGCCLNVRAQDALRAAGLSPLLSECNAVPIDSLRLAAGGRVATVPLPGYASLSREALDAALVQSAIEAGCQFLPRTRASAGEVSAQARTLTLSQGETRCEVSARLILAADGLGGGLLRRDGEVEPSVRSGSRIGAGTIASHAPEAYRRGTIYMACGEGGYVGLVRLEDGRLDIAAAFDADRVRREGGLAGAASRILDSAGLPGIVNLEQLTWRGTPALTRAATRLSAHRALILGDAAGYVEPFTGEGMAWAFSSAMAVARLVPQAVARFDTSVERAWSREYRRIVTRRQFVC
ncbi:MAG: FAD-dependent monooxygenase, partial [Candidatus Hydrogenedentes bacterium]|nr:FAD-dependent monooxygenase [Candidatus Hydrogenedentota bacterium]